jgi:hypothetical protein
MVCEVAISRAMPTVRPLVITSVRVLVTAESALVVVTCVTVHGARVVTREQLACLVACVHRGHESPVVVPHAMIQSRSGLSKFHHDSARFFCFHQPPPA